MIELNRREFAEVITLATLAPMLGQWPRLPGAGPEPAALAKALAGAIRAQYGGRLTEEDLATVTRQIEASLDRAVKVREVPLTNGDEPDFVFSAVREEHAV